MNIKILGGETLGTRSLATFVECSSINILIDPGVALGPRYGLMPHPLEYQRLIETRKRIEEHAENSNVICISHYHYDHYTPFWKNTDLKWTYASIESALKIYKNKKIFLKSISSNINFSQKSRGLEFINNLKKHAYFVEEADGKEIRINSTVIKFSTPVFHGEENTPLGFVIMILIKDKGEKFLFASDVEGPISKDTLQLILDYKPDYLLISGPPLYLVGSKLKPENFQQGIKNLEKICKEINHIIVDHHLMRSKDSLQYIDYLKNIAKIYNVKVQTIAEFCNKEIEMLEANRDKLYKNF